MNKDLKDLRQQKDVLITSMNKLPKDSNNYEQLLKNYRQCVETEEIIRKGKRERGPLETGLKIGTLLVSVAGAIVVPQILADKSYDNEKDMSIKNGTIWNLIGRRFDK